MKIIKAKEMLAEVVDYFDIKTTDIFKVPKNKRTGAKKEARAVFVMLCLKYTRHSIDEIAFTLKTDPHIVKEIQRSMQSHKTLQNLYNDVEQIVLHKYYN